MKWRKLHKKVWLDPRLRAHGREATCALLDLTMLADDDGLVSEDPCDLAALAGLPEARHAELLALFLRLGLTENTEDGLVVVTVRDDAQFSASRANGGVAVRNAGKMPKRCRRDARGMPSEASAPASGTSGDLSESESDARAKAKPTPAVPVPAALDKPEFHTAMAEWVTYRRERKLPVWKPSTLRSNFEKWEAWGVAKTVEAIRASITASWQGVFEPKADGGFGGARNGSSKPSGPTVPSRKETEKMLAEQRAIPVTAPPANLRDLFEKAKREAKKDPVPVEADTPF